MHSVYLLMYKVCCLSVCLKCKFCHSCSASHGRQETHSHKARERERENEFLCEIIQFLGYYYYSYYLWKHVQEIINCCLFIEKMCLASSIAYNIFFFKQKFPQKVLLAILTNSDLKKNSLTVECCVCVWYPVHTDWIWYGRINLFDEELRNLIDSTVSKCESCTCFLTQRDLNTVIIAFNWNSNRSHSQQLRCDFTLNCTNTSSNWLFMWWCIQAYLD